MKSLDKLSIFFAGFLLTACFGDLEPLDPIGPVKPDPETKTLSFVLPSSGFKTAWKAGDQIVIHGEYAEDQVTVTLEATDISSDGKTASREVNGLYPYVSKEYASTLYASWPASESSNLTHCFCYTGFKPTTTSPMMAACNDGDTFNFKDVSSAISFSVSGDYDGYAITGRKDAVVGYDYFQVKLTDNVQNFSQYREGPLVTITGALKSGAKQLIYLPGDINLPNGFVLKLFKGETALKAYTHKDEVSVGRGNILDFGNITSLLKDYEMDINVSAAVSLADGGTANCYIVNAPGVYKIPAVKGNTDESVGTADHAEVIWETWNNAEEVTPKSVIQACTYEGGYVYLQVTDSHHSGNALIAAVDEDDNILWSWHIWVPQTAVADITEANFGATAVMSRNLGALVDATIDSPAPVESFGLLYQWGRKDPFPGIGSVSDNTPATVAGTPVYAENAQSPVADAVKHPNVLYYKEKSDWQSEGLDVASTLWGEGKKTVYDPCPAGYTMPTRNKSYGFWSGNTMVETGYFVLNEANCAFSVGSLVFPLAGYTSHEEGAWTGAGTNALVWSGRWDSGTQNGYGMFGTAGSEAKFRNQGNIRSMAGSVRCVVL